MTLPYLSLEHPIRFAHRGSGAIWPENTMYAFERAVALGYRYIETDVRMSRDGVVVVFHDTVLDRTTNGTGRVDEWRWEDLQHLDAAYWFDGDAGYPLRGTGVRISSLAELFAALPDVRFNLDLKGPGLEWAVWDVIRAAGRSESTMIGSFHGGRLRRFRRITRGAVPTSAGPGEVAAMLAASRAGRGVGRLAAYQVPHRMGRLTVVDGRFVAACHAAGAQVHVWTVNEAAEMHELLDLGVDGIMTDRPARLNEVIAARG